MRELTLRYPGHAAKIRAIRDAGFLSHEKIDVGGARVAPVEFTGRLLFLLWQYAPGEEDMTLFFAEADGHEDGAPVSARWTMLDRYDRATGFSSMARTTGYTATAVLRLLASGGYQGTGVVPPEKLGEDETSFRFLIDQLAQRGVVLQRS
jgi:saccharopine dehydrogenase-like NADP-dependent oxidoreductase